MKLAPTLFLALALGAAMVRAEEAPPATACTKPAMLPEAPTPEQIDGFNLAFKEYGACVKRFAAEQQAEIRRLEDAAKARQEAANALIDEYNQFVKTDLPAAQARAARAAGLPEPEAEPAPQPQASPQSGTAPQRAN